MASFFRYNVRTAYIYLDDPPPWFAKQQQDHLTAEQAREFAGTDGAPIFLCCFWYWWQLN